MSDPPAIVSVGRTRFGEHYEREPEDLIEEAGLLALDSAGIERKDLDACYISDYFLQITNKIGIEEGFMSQLLETHVPMEKMRSFSSAFTNACHAVEAGKYDKVLVGGVEKMTDRWDKIRDDLMLLEDPWSYYAGCTPEANHELLLREYVKKYGVSGEDYEELKRALALISVKNHRNALNNKFAQFRREVKVESVLKARARAHKALGIYDFATVSDGATALVLMKPETARNYTDSPIHVLACCSATDYIVFPSREDRTGFLASRIAMENALKMSNMSLGDLSIAEVYDQSTVLEMAALEDLGFSQQGEAWRHVNKSLESSTGPYELDGMRLFVNTNGGLKADGNPLGATGGAQIFEVVRQLRGEAEEAQISVDGDLSFGCVQEIEGFGTKAYVHILGSELA